MTIKKTLSIKKPTMSAASQASAEGGADVHTAAVSAVADRYRLDAPDAPKKSAGGGVGTTLAVIAGVAALIVAGILTFVMYNHWEFLQGA